MMVERKRGGIVPPEVQEEIRRRYAEEVPQPTMEELGREFGVSEMTVHRVLQGKGAYGGGRRRHSAVPPASSRQPTAAEVAEIEASRKRLEEKLAGRKGEVEDPKVREEAERAYRKYFEGK